MRLLSRVVPAPPDTGAAGDSGVRMAKGLVMAGKGSCGAQGRGIVSKWGGAQGLQLQQLGPDAPGPVRVDFVEGGAAHRRLYGGGSGQMIAKAVGVAQGVRPRVLDATAGLGKDGFVLASLGCEISLIERQPLIGALLEDGLARAAEDFEVAPIVARMRLLNSWPSIRGM